MIIKKHTFLSGREFYIIFDDKNIHINKLITWKSVDSFCIYDLILISFYPDASAPIYDVNCLDISYDAILYYLNDKQHIKVEEDSDEFKEISNLYNTLI